MEKETKSAVRKYGLFAAGCFAVMALFLSNSPKGNTLDNPIGSITDPANNAHYSMVKNADGVTHAVGAIMVYYNGTTADGIEVTTTTTANNALVAGIVVGNTLPAGSSSAYLGYGMIQDSGYCPTVTTDGNVTAGDTLVTSVTAGAVTTYTVAMATGSAAGQATSFGVLGTALNTDTSTTGDAILRLR